MLPPPSPATLARLRGIRHVALDMDGTIYRGGTVFPWTGPFLARLRKLGLDWTFLTNNPSKSAADYLAHLGQMGIPARPTELHTSAHATIGWLHQHRPGWRRLFALGTPSMQTEFAAAGFTLTADDPAEVPDAVVIGFDPTLTYARLGRAAWWIQQGKPYVATNPDRVCPTDRPTVLVDCGALCALLASATGQEPEVVLGKPDPAMLAGILARHGLRAEEVAMVGDRLYTDVLMAHRAGALGVLVLSGEATAAEAAAADPAPHLVLPTLAELGELLAAAHSSPR